MLQLYSCCTGTGTAVIVRLAIGMVRWYDSGILIGTGTGTGTCTKHYTYGTRVPVLFHYSCIDTGSMVKHVPVPYSASWIYSYCTTVPYEY
jgi:hypothetical protein